VSATVAIVLRLAAAAPARVREIEFRLGHHCERQGIEAVQQMVRLDLDRIT
jgi:hypothetical protein